MNKKSSVKLRAGYFALAFLLSALASGIVFFRDKSPFSGGLHKEPAASIASEGFASPVDYELTMALVELRKGDVDPLLAYARARNIVQGQFTRLAVYAFSSTAPAGITNWLRIAKMPLESGSTMTLLSATMAVDFTIVKECFLQGHVSEKSPLFRGAILLIASMDSSWIDQNLIRLCKAYPEQGKFFAESASNLNAAKSLFSVWLSSPQFSSDGEQVSRIFDSLLAGQKGSGSSGDEELTKLAVQTLRKNNGATEKSSRRYALVIDQARNLLLPGSQNDAGYLRVDNRNLLATLAARPNDVQNYILQDVLTASSTTSEGAVEFLANAKSIRESCSFSLSSSQPLCRWLARGLMGQVDDKANPEKFSKIEDALAAGGIKGTDAARLKTKLLSASGVQLTAEAIVGLPPGWQAAGAKHVLYGAAGGGVDSFLRAADRIRGYLSGDELLQAGIAQHIDVYGAYADQVAAAIPPGSLTTEGGSFDRADMARFAFNNPTLLTGGTEQLSPVFQSWARMDPLECSAFLSTLSPSPAKASAIRGMLKEIQSSDPVAAGIWEAELKKIGTAE